MSPVSVAHSDFYKSPALPVLEALLHTRNFGIAFFAMLLGQVHGVRLEQPIYEHVSVVNIFAREFFFVQEGTQDRFGVLVRLSMVTICC